MIVLEKEIEKMRIIFIPLESYLMIVIASKEKFIGKAVMEIKLKKKMQSER